MDSLALFELAIHLFLRRLGDRQEKSQVTNTDCR